MKQSAGIVVYRRGAGELEVLLVHPSGHYNRHAPWGIPKGLLDEGETLEQAARRETLEETGVTAGKLTSLDFIDYTKSRKRIHAFAGEWLAGEPHCASWEIDQTQWCSLAQARELIHHEQWPFLERLERLLADSI